MSPCACVPECLRAFMRSPLRARVRVRACQGALACRQTRRNVTVARELCTALCVALAWLQASV
eukprot:9675700-Alexandrium_andersonii.AAC.1